jgi:hypothetical protein
MVKPSAKLLVLPYSIGVCFVYLVGIVNFLTNLEENKCDMTFMYEFPQYTVSTQSPKTILPRGFLISFVLSVSQALYV